MRKDLDYLCLQPTRQGQASYAHVNEIVAGLRRRGWRVRLVEPPLPRPGAGDGARRAVAGGLVQLRYWLVCAFRPARFVYIRSHFLALPTAILARMAGSIVIQEVNGPATDIFDAWPQLRRLRRLLALVGRAQVRLADEIVVVTPGLEAYLRAETGRERGYHVIGNGANVDVFHPLAGAGPPDRPPYVVFVGALASWQGIDTILRAAHATAWPRGVDLVVAGDGIERELVTTAAREDPRIRWLGTIPYEDSASLVAGSLAALVPMADVPRSRYGLSPLKLFEAMACGVPVVASDLPGLGDVVRQHDCGVTFRAGDADELAGAVGRLARDREEAREMGLRGRAAASAQYSWDARAGQTEAVLLQALRRRAGSRRGRRPLPGRRP